jgi:hypothetical protein
MSHDEVPTPEQERDDPNVGRIVGVAVATLLVFGAGIVWVLLILRSSSTPPDAFVPPRPNEINASEIGIVDQPMFEADERLRQLNDRKRRWLETYGWVDRDAGTIHIPIEQAMDRVAAEARQ